LQLFGSTSQTNGMWALPQLSQGDNLYVDGPMSFDGTASLKTYNANTISFDMAIKADGKVLGFDVDIPFALRNGVAYANVTINKVSEGQYSLTITDINNPSYKQTELVSATERTLGSGKEITFSSNNKVRCTMTATSGSLSIKAPNLPFEVRMSKTNSFSGDAYRNSVYSSGYSQGAMAVAPIASTITGLGNGVVTMSSNLGGIFGTILDLMVSILNTIANLISKLVSGVMGLFGAGKKDKNEGIQANQGNNPNQAMNMNAMNNSQATPSGTDINQAYSVVDGDLKGVQNPNQGLQIMNLHANKAKDYRDKAEQLGKEAEKESRVALAAAQTLQKNPTDSNALAKLQSSKTRAMDLIKVAQEYTKAVYDESLYVQVANDILNNKFQGAMGQNGAKLVQDSAKNWSGGATEKQFVFFNKNLKSAPEALQMSMNAVNANIGQATQILSSIRR
jgi:hypothetical protein